MSKKISTLLLALCMVLPLAACGSGSGTTASSAAGEVATADTASGTAAANACLTAIPEYTNGASTVTLCDGQNEVLVTYTLTYDADGRWISTAAASEEGGGQTLENRWNSDGRRIGGVYSLMPDLLFIDDFYPDELIDTSVDYATNGLPQSFSNADVTWGRAYDDDGNVLMEVTENDGLSYEYSDGFIDEIYYTVDGAYGSYIEYTLDGNGRVSEEKCLKPGEVTYEISPEGVVTGQKTGENTLLWYATREYDTAGHLITRSIYKGGTELWGIYRFEY